MGAILCSRISAGEQTNRTRSSPYKALPRLTSKSDVPWREKKTHFERRDAKSCGFDNQLPLEEPPFGRSNTEAEKRVRAIQARKN